MKTYIVRSIRKCDRVLGYFVYADKDTRIGVDDDFDMSQFNDKVTYSLISKSKVKAVPVSKPIIAKKEELPPPTPVAVPEPEPEPEIVAPQVPETDQVPEVEPKLDQELEDRVSDAKPKKPGRPQAKR